jgi:hypothetical protein
MSKVIKVSGDSPVLGRVLTVCLEASPWLTLTQNQIEIDWPLAFSRWQEKKAKPDFPSSLIPALEALLPAWPLAWSAYSKSHDYSEREKFTVPQNVKAFLLPEIVPVPEQVRNYVQTFELKLNELFSALKIESQSGPPETELGKFAAYLNKFLSSGELHILKKNRTVHYDLRKRLVVMRSDVGTFVRGSFEDFYYSYGNQSDVTVQRVVSWRLAKQLVRIHGHFFEQLEALVRHSGSAASKLDYETNLAPSIERMARIERALAGLLATGDQKRSGSARSSFAQVKTEFVHDKNIDGVDRRAPNYFGSKPPHTPLEQLAQNIEGLAYELRNMRSNVNEIKVLRSEIFSAAGLAVEAVRAASQKIYSDTSGNIEMGKISYAIDRLIMESPIFTLIASQAITTVFDAADESYCFCLSPWLTTTVMARRLLKQYPMTYLAPDGVSEEGEEDVKENENPKNTSRKVSRVAVSGRRLWELATDPNLKT